MTDVAALSRVPPRPSAVLLDMDGTLTEPLLDFDAIKRDMGIGSAPILEAMRRMPPAERAAAEAVLYRHESGAAANSTLNAGCRELLDWLAEVRLPTALVTRNTRASVETVLARHGLAIDVCVTREDGRYKPDPAPLLLACDRLGVDPAGAWMVGDGNHDVEAGVAAGMFTVWVGHGADRPFDAEPSRTVRTLPELQALLRRAVDPGPVRG